MSLYSSLSFIQSELKKGNTTCVGIVQYYLSNIEAHKHLNAFLEVYTDEALQKAKVVDEKIKSGTAGRLAGAVIAVKDVLCHRNHKVSASSKILGGFTSLYSGTAVERLEKEDAIIIGRTNCDEFAMGSSNENSAYGLVKNGLDETKVPGGSSGGSAVAVQMNMCLASLGTDTGGSIRQPASFCGVVGLKPTYGRISRYGLIAYASSFDQIGTFTHNIEDAAILLEVMAGKDEFDSTVSSVVTENYSKKLDFNGKARIAYFHDCIHHEGLDKEVGEGVLQLIEKLKKEGHTVEEVPFNALDYLVPVYYVLTTAEASSNLSRFDGIRYGYRSAQSDDLESTYKKSRSEGFGKEVKRRIMLGTFVLSAGYYDAYYSKGQKARRYIKEKTDDILNKYDFILTPTTPTTAFGINEKTDDPISMYLADIFTVQAPICGLPAISLPLKKHSNGMPYGIQLISGKFKEAQLLAFSDYLIKQVK